MADEARLMLRNVRLGSSRGSLFVFGDRLELATDDDLLINYVDAAVESLAAGKTVKTAQTKAYGCGVKYGS